MTISEVLDAVRDGGAQAALAFTRQFDQIEMPLDAVIWNPLAEAPALIDAELREAIEFAIDRVWEFHQKTLPARVVVTPGWGLRVEERFVPLSRVGVYVPNGHFPLISTLLMTAVPARVAGVGELVAAISPRRAVRESALWTYLFQRMGIGEVVLLGGAQAIGALAYGLSGFLPVDLIAGPGNRFVTEAKQEVARRGVVGIDLAAGPSEVMIIAEDPAWEEFIVADLLAQAEHDADAKAVFVTRNSALADRVRQRTVDRPPGMGSIEVTVVGSEEDLVRIANERAPEHLGLMGAQVESLHERIWAAGAIFLGPMAGQALGDYVAGPSHVLPTGGTGRFQSGLSTRTFLKRVSIIEASEDVSPIPYQYAARLAELEGLVHHASSMTLRQYSLDGKGRRE